MGFLKEHIRLLVAIVITLVVLAVLFSFLLGGDVKAVGIGFVVVLAVLLTALGLVGVFMLIGWVLRKGRHAVSLAMKKVTHRTPSPTERQPSESAHVTVSSDDINWRKYDGSV
mgnify:CR=1 FL=1